jgi:hypothetical protein
MLALEELLEGFDKQQLGLKHFRFEFLLVLLDYWLLRF